MERKDVWFFTLQTWSSSRLVSVGGADKWLIVLIVEHSFLNKGGDRRFWCGARVLVAHQGAACSDK